ncbi:EsV-1-73 [Ectocarpus siliculosus virus 1]|uniref:EsV-1-73 n=1 Tax=Ectocarpus siliculosus virus 1 (isolate New Zealand/Kaikoura/1988) TaxID=654926 RepID=Q8QNK0_ESV1K|nr:EsV-1-73 [Ectocarpus siliculosus virus 1]AAK14496.1 EsV-1-73 [Ectocarpus siliculosus virus 1]
MSCIITQTLAQLSRMTVIRVSKKTARRCHVCKARLKIHEGKLCSCSMLLCMKHRYKADHFCPAGKVVHPMDKIEPRKIEKI